MLWETDPIFYPSPKLAMQAPAEKLAYVAALNASGGSQPDALIVVDVDRESDSEWGTPNMVEDGVKPELLLGGKYGHSLHIWDLRKRRHLQALDLGAEQQMVLELRAAHDSTKAYGFVGVVTLLKDLSSSIWCSSVPTEGRMENLKSRRSLRFRPSPPIRANSLRYSKASKLCRLC